MPEPPNHRPRQPYRYRAQWDGRVATLGELQKSRSGKWFWAYCCNTGCSHKRAIPLAPYVIRYGAEASSDRLRKNLKCTKCGARGAVLSAPSWMGTEIGDQPFPID